MHCAFFLDFDGVICDSLNECFVSSWMTLYGFENGIRSLDIETNRLFRLYRPYIRRGADYVLLQECLRDGIVITGQDDFDRLSAAKGQKVMNEYHERMYAVRERLLENEPAWWLSLHRLYPGIAGVIRSACILPQYYILSTKKTEFITAILLHFGLAWPSRRIIYSGQKSKADIIRSIMKREYYADAVFIDDQADHLAGLDRSPLRGYLAGWGYVKREWLESRLFRSVALSDLPGLLGIVGSQEQ